MDNETGDVFKDDTFAIHVSKNMEIRNALRSGILEASRQDSGKIPLFVSWPEWLDDGIICMYAKDFREFVRNCTKEATEELGTAVASVTIEKTVREVAESKKNALPES